MLKVVGIALFLNFSSIVLNNLNIFTLILPQLPG